FTRLSQMNFGIDTGFYPLGSCTMKFNPKFTEELAALPTVTRIHPDQDESTVQGALRVLYELQDLLARIAGMDAVTLQPAAGAQGEYPGLLLARAYHRERGEARRRVIVPERATRPEPRGPGRWASRTGSGRSARCRGWGRRAGPTPGTTTALIRPGKCGRGTEPWRSWSGPPPPPSGGRRRAQRSFRPCRA